jgi:hypothetical protein
VNAQLSDYISLRLFLFQANFAKSFSEFCYIVCYERFYPPALILTSIYRLSLSIKGNYITSKGNKICCVRTGRWSKDSYSFFLRRLSRSEKRNSVTAEKIGIGKRGPPAVNKGGTHSKTCGLLRGKQNSSFGLLGRKCVALSFGARPSAQFLPREVRQSFGILFKKVRTSFNNCNPIHNTPSKGILY